jgi:hypothetical protein
MATGMYNILYFKDFSARTFDENVKHFDPYVRCLICSFLNEPDPSAVFCILKFSSLGSC